jgi:tetratricopeptide (TPR) repeat protein
MYRKNISLIVLFVILITLKLSAQDISTGIKLMRNEKFAEAKKCFTGLLTSKSNAVACFYLGEIYLNDVNVDSANFFYNSGITANHDFPLNYAGLVKLNLLNKNKPEAEKYFQQATEIGEDDPQTYVVLCEAYSFFNDGENFDKALTLSDDALRLKPDYVNAYIARGNIYLKKGDGTEAIKNFQRAIDIDPTNPQPLVLKAMVYTLITNYNAATQLLNDAINNDPSYSPAYRELAELNATLKNYSKAAEYYSQYIEKSEITTERQKRFASILYLNKEYDKAINILKDVNYKEPDNASTIRILAYSYFRLGDIETSKFYFKKLFEIPSVEYLATDYENYADLLSQTGNDSLAVSYLLKIPEMDSSRKDIYGKISIICFKKKDWNCVITSLKNKCQISAQEYFDLGKAYYFVQDYQNADSTFSILSAKVPDLAIAYFWQARVKTNFDPESDSGLAKPYYEKFIEISKEDTSKFKKELIEAYSYLGYYYYLKENNANSKIYWQKVHALDPKNNQAIEALKSL